MVAHRPGFKLSSVSGLPGFSLLASRLVDGVVNLFVLYLSQHFFMCVVGDLVLAKVGRALSSASLSCPEGEVMGTLAAEAILGPGQLV